MAKFQRAIDCVNCPYQSKTFDFLDTKEKRNIQENCLIVNFKKGENICKQDLNVTHSLYLSKGLVKVFIESEKMNTILNIATAGQYVGLQSIFDGKSYNFSITALEPSRVCMIEVANFKELSETNPKFLYAVTKSISECTNQVFKRLTFFYQKSVKSRLASSLLFFSDKIYKSDEFIFSLSRQDLADYIGVSRENTVRVLSELKKEKIVEASGKNIKIANKEALRFIENAG
ncbi:MAG: Crp/Fnr family transcriptional regulator [Bacteroidales bacterium]|nr:Crp/Fnr family transcriptional regulator [Bacteroidales bacterium]